MADPDDYIQSLHERVEAAVRSEMPAIQLAPMMIGLHKEITATLDVDDLSAEQRQSLHDTLTLLLVEGLGLNDEPMLDHVIFENGESLIITDTLAWRMVEHQMIYECSEDHPDDARYYHFTDEFATFVKRNT